MNWSDLLMKDRASYIKLAVENGIYNLNSIRAIYNSFAEGGPIKAMRATPTKSAGGYKWRLKYDK